MSSFEFQMKEKDNVTDMAHYETKIKLLEEKINEKADLS
jgi:hypothetical protein